MTRTFLEEAQTALNRDECWRSKCGMAHCQLMTNRSLQKKKSSDLMSFSTDSSSKYHFEGITSNDSLAHRAGVSLGRTFDSLSVMICVESSDDLCTPATIKCHHLTELKCSFR